MNYPYILIINELNEGLKKALTNEIDGIVLKQIEVENQCKNRQKIPMIFSKSIRCQKPTKKPYIKRLRRVIRM